jgi:hypothetical protein
MGTSKSYISLKGGDHTHAKRGLTSFLHGGSVSKQDVAARFASALKSEAHSSTGGGGSSSSIKNYSSYAARFINFLGNVSSNGLSYASEQARLSSIPKSIDEMIKLFTESDISDTIDSSVTAIALQETLEVLVPTLDELQNVNLAEFTKELIANIIAVCFEQRYFEEILKKCDSITDARLKCNEIKEYIHSDIVVSLDTSTVNQIHTDTNVLSAFVEKKCIEAFNILINFYDMK